MSGHIDVEFKRLICDRCGGHWMCAMFGDDTFNKVKVMLHYRNTVELRRTVTALEERVLDLESALSAARAVRGLK